MEEEAKGILEARSSDGEILWMVDGYGSTAKSLGGGVSVGCPVCSSRK